MAKVSDKPIIILDEPKSGLCRGQMINMIDILQQMVPKAKSSNLSNKKELRI